MVLLYWKFTERDNFHLVDDFLLVSINAYMPISVHLPSLRECVTQLHGECVNVPMGNAEAWGVYIFLK